MCFAVYFTKNCWKLVLKIINLAEFFMEYTMQSCIWSLVQNFIMLWWYSLADNYEANLQNQTDFKPTKSTPRFHLKQKFEQAIVKNAV